MTNQNINRSISVFIIIAIFSLPLVLPLTTLAASSERRGLNWDNPNQNNAFQMDASFLTNNTMALIGCSGIIDTVTDAALKLATKVVSKILKLEQTVPVADAGTSRELKKSNRIASCYNGLAYSLARQQLVGMTKSTMNWVNSGFNGDPMYVRNVTSLTRNIENEIIKAELDLLKNPNSERDYPYGRIFAESQIRSYQSFNNYEDSMKSDLTGYLSDGATIDSFSDNFSEGGWSGWLALTQKSKNNPMGYMIEKSQHVANKKEAEVTATKEELNRNGGMLDQKKCAEYGKKVIKGTGGLMDMTVADPDKCIRYETVTPGSLIKDKIGKYLNSPETQLELADSLNEVLYSIFGNLISRFQQNGLASLSSNTEDFSAVSGGIGSNRVIDENGKDITKRNGGSGGYINEAFDITKDLGENSTTCLGDSPLGIGADKNTCGIIETQEKYIQTVQKLFPPLDMVMAKLGELDYCIPGPNPNWINNTAYTKDSYTNYLYSIKIEKDGGNWDIIIPAEDDTVTKNYIYSLNDSLTHFWATVKSSWYFDLFDDWDAGLQRNAQGRVNSAVEGRLDDLEKTIAEYAAYAEQEYGFKSSMQRQLNVDREGNVISENSDYLEMAQAGLRITKDIMTYDESISEMEDVYNDKIGESRSNIYNLKIIKGKVDKIVAEAQARRDAARKAAGLEPISPECKSNENTIITQ